MGRKPKVTTEYEKEQRKKTGERIKALAKREHITQIKLAESLGISVSTIGNYIRGTYPMDREVAKTLESMTGIISYYWLGETDCLTWEEYSLEQFASAVDRHEELQKEKQILIDKRKSLFSLIRFQYEVSDSYSLHQITSNSTPSLTASFSDTEIQSLFSKLQEVIELEVFKKAKQV